MKAGHLHYVGHPVTVPSTLVEACDKNLIVHNSDATTLVNIETMDTR